MTSQKNLLRPSSLPALKPLTVCALALMLVALPAAAKSTNRQPAATPASLPEASHKALARERVVSLTFKQMGAWSPVNLRGVDGSRTLSFSLRGDEVVVGARLKLGYDYSPALIAELSHLRVLLNERVAMVEALPQAKGLANSREIPLDPRLFGEFNNLRFNLIGHYTRQCEDPFHSSLWLTISDLSRLELTLAPRSLANDLKYLPAPFFDKRDNTPLTLPFVFSTPPSVGTMKSAGIVASWFGLQAGARGAQFPVSLTDIPDGNAVVFIQGGERIAGVKEMPGSTVSIQPHPENPRAKLLVVTGGSDDEMARAARAIALISPALVGQSVSVTKETASAPRQPYDAPAWVPIDRPVRVGELARPDELRVQGYFPEVVRLNYRVPPDLFTWRTPGVPLELKYRASRLPSHKNSSLNVNINTSFIHALALNDPQDEDRERRRATLLAPGNLAQREANLFIPPYATGGRDQLQFSYFFDIVKEGECKNLPPDNLQAAIDPESTLDFSGFPHYVALPNLAYFASIGFPFTRLADLSETAVILPERPNPDELGLYLTLMGRMGEATAYPVLRHTVVAPSEVEAMADRDLIVIGSSTSQSLMAKWVDRLPMVQLGGERRLREPQATWWPSYRWEQQDVQTLPAPRGRLNLSGSGKLATLMAFESPLKSSRSVVFLYADQATDLHKLSDVLTDPERVASIKGDFVVVDDKEVSHAKVSETYYLGALPTLKKLRWFLADQPLVLALLGLLMAILIAAMAYGPLRRKLAHRFKKAD